MGVLIDFSMVFEAFWYQFGTELGPERLSNVPERFEGNLEYGSALFLLMSSVFSRLMSRNTARNALSLCPPFFDANSQGSQWRSAKSIENPQKSEGSKTF